MGIYGSENFKMQFLLEIAAESFQTFLPNGPHQKKKVWGFQNLKIKNVTNFIPRLGIFESLDVDYFQRFFSNISKLTIAAYGIGSSM